MPISTSSFFSINLEFAVSTASTAQLSLQDTAIVAQVYPAGGGRLFGPIDLSSIQSASTASIAYAGAANFGWFAGGLPGGSGSIERINFNNDTVLPSRRGDLQTGTRAMGGVSNSNYGWFIGGWEGGAGIYSVIQRLDFSNDSPIGTSVRGPLTLARGYGGSAGNANYGWFAGGQDVPATPGTIISYSTVNRIDFANDSPASASPRGPLAVARWGMAAAGNQNYGWFVSGGVAADTIVSTIERLDYSNDSLSARVSLPMPRKQLAGASNNNYGWFGGGWMSSPTTFLSLVHRIDFANDNPTSASPRGPLSSARSSVTATGNSNYGWWIGGGNPTAVSTVDRVDYSNDTVTASARGTLINSRYDGTAISNYVKTGKGVLGVARQPFTEVWTVNTFTNQGSWLGVPGTYGWYGGGFPGTPAMTTQIDRIDFSNDSPTAAATRGSLTQARTQMGAGTNGTYGWWAGGYGPGTTTQSTVNRLAFSNDTAASVARGSLSVVKKGNPVGLPNSDYLWFAGGPNPITSIERLDYSNDAGTLSVRGNLLTGYSGSAGSSNQFYGWVAGGNTPGSPPPVVSRVERMDFANDSPTSASLRGPLTVAKTAMAAGGNSNYGWIAGGDTGGPNTSVVERIDYSNESPTAASPRSPLAASNAQGRLTTNVNYGWYGGGGNPTSSAVSRIDFSNDTVTASPRGPLTATMNHEIGAATSNYVTARSQPAGTTTSTAYFPASIVPTPATPYAASPGTYAYFAGGSGTTVDRIDFSNDSPTSASPRSILPVSAGANAGTANASYGWISGGAASNQSIYRIDFGSDTTIASTRGSLVSGSQDLAAAGNANYGWFAGGGGVTSRVERINYANDSPASASPRGPLSLARQSFAAAATGAYGWFTGGYTPGNTSVVDRIDFSNDSPTSATARAALPITNRDMAAMGNENYGWVMGGTPVISTVYRIDYANDTNAATTRGPLSRTRSNMKGAGNAGFGWVGGNSPADNTVDRIDYANDSPTSASPRGNLSASRSSFAAVSNYVKGGITPGTVGNAIIYTTGTSISGTSVSGYVSTTVIGTSANIGTYGWFSAGAVFPSVRTSAVDRINFSNDSPTAASPRGLGSVARTYLASASNASYGWFGGGFGSPSPLILSTVDRIDFANDSPTSASVRGPLTAAKGYIAAASNANYGWFGGGNPGVAAAISAVDRIDFANDSPTSASPRGPLSRTRDKHAATGNENYGWWAGGYIFPAGLSSVDRIDYANDSPTSASPRGLLVISRFQFAATSNSNYGWFAGGSGTTVDRIDFANDSPTAASRRGPLTEARNALAAAGNANYGWFGAGSLGSSSNVERIDYSNDSPTSSSTRGPLSAARYASGASSNYVKGSATYTTSTSLTTNIVYSIVVNSNYGWFAGGFPGPVALSVVERMDFTNDTSSSSARGPLSAPRRNLAATGNSNYGWIVYGYSSTHNSIIDRIDFSNDNLQTIARATGGVARYQLAGAGNNNYGWFGGGYTDFATPGHRSIVERIDYSNDLTTPSIRGLLSLGRSALAATSNNNYAWFGGGNTPGSVSVVDRIDFSNDSPATASVRGASAGITSNQTAVGNNNYGWFHQQFSSSVNRIDYSNDSPSSASPRGPLSKVRYSDSAAGNDNYGWFTGNQPVSSDVDRIDYSNDTAAASVRGPMVTNRSQSAGTSNTAKDNRTFSAFTGNVGTYGWFLGGETSPSPTAPTTVDRIDFSNDSPTAASGRGPLTASSYDNSGVSNANYGWSLSGLGTTNVYRVDFANDTANTTVRGPLSQDHQRAAAASNANYGWISGGLTKSSVDRIDFANDSPATSSQRGPLTIDRRAHGATGNANYGWHAGAGTSGSDSSVDRIDYANDSPTAASPRGPLSASNQYIYASGNANYGWFNGGFSSSRIDRIDFANDSPTSASPRGPLSFNADVFSGSTSNANYGWWCGGGTSSAVTRIDFANDSPTTSSTRGPLSIARGVSAAVSNYVKSRTEITVTTPVNWAGGTWVRGGLSIA